MIVLFVYLVHYSDIYGPSYTVALFFASDSRAPNYQGLAKDVGGAAWSVDVGGLPLFLYYY